MTDTLATPEIVPEPVIQHRNTLGSPTLPLLFGTPTLGTVRIEWVNALDGLVVPTNWAMAKATPTGYLVDDAQNILVQTAVSRNAEWLLLVEDDTMPPPDFYLKLRRHFEAKLAPVISGLYYIKESNPPEPLVYRGRGNGAYRDWTPGELVWCDGVPTGCLAIHQSVYKPLWEAAEWYDLPSQAGGVKVRRVFESPRQIIWDGAYAHKFVGTSDLSLCDRILKERLLAKTPWPHLADEPYPFVVDTSIKCGHIDRHTGIIY